MWHMVRIVRPNPIFYQSDDNFQFGWLMVLTNSLESFIREISTTILVQFVALDGTRYR